MKSIYFVVSLVLVLCSAVSATQEMPPEIKANMSITVPDSVKPGDVFDVVFRFETLEELHVDSASPHRAALGIPEQATLLKGDTLWTGFLRAGEPQTLTAIVRLDDTSLCSFHGVLYTLGSITPPIVTSSGEQYYVRHVNTAYSRFLNQRNCAERQLVPTMIVTDTGTHDTLAEMASLQHLTLVPGTIAPIKPEYTTHNVYSIDYATDHRDTLWVSSTAGAFYHLNLGQESVIHLKVEEGKADVRQTPERLSYIEVKSDSAVIRLEFKNTKKWLVVKRVDNNR